MRLLASIAILVLISGCVNDPDRSGIHAGMTLSIAELDFLPKFDIQLDIATQKGTCNAQPVSRADRRSCF